MKSQEKVVVVEQNISGKVQGSNFYGSWVKALEIVVYQLYTSECLLVMQIFFRYRCFTLVYCTADMGQISSKHPHICCCFHKKSSKWKLYNTFLAYQLYLADHCATDGFRGIGIQSFLIFYQFLQISQKNKKFLLWNRIVQNTLYCMLCPPSWHKLAWYNAIFDNFFLIIAPLV